MNSPVDEMEPQFVAQVAPLPAVNCCVAFSKTVGFDGEIENVVEDEDIVSLANAVYCGVLGAIASMVQVDPTVPLAVKSPVGLMEPQVAVQVTWAFAVNCCV